MSRIFFLIPVFVGLMAIDAAAQESFQTDILKTSQGDLEITFIGHGSLMFSFNGKVIHVDPFSRLAEYTKLPKADMLLITHEHGDHLDLKAVEAVRTDKTVLVLTKTCAARLKGGIIMQNGDSETVGGLKIDDHKARYRHHLGLFRLFCSKNKNMGYQGPAFVLNMSISDLLLSN